MRDGYRKLQEAIIADHLKPGGLRFDPQRLEYIRFADDEIVFEFVSSSISVPYDELTGEEARFALRYYVDHFEAKEDEGKSPLDPRPWKKPSWVLKINYTYGLLMGGLLLAVFGILVLNAIFTSIQPAYNPDKVARDIALNDPHIKGLTARQDIRYTIDVSEVGYKKEYPGVGNNLTVVTFTTFSFGNVSEWYKVDVDIDNKSVAGIAHYYVTGQLIERW